MIMQDAVFESTNQTLEVLAFRICEQDFCFDLDSVREIRGWTETTMLPHAQPCVKGVINLRGAVVPVIDLAQRLGLGTMEPGPRHVIIIAVLEDKTVGLLADVVSDILVISRDDIQPVPEIVDAAARRFISGVVVIEDRMIRKMDLRLALPDADRTAA